MNTHEAKINIVELASELAGRELHQYADQLSEADYRHEFPNGLIIEDEEEIHYTEEGQDKFNELYDQYYTLIERTKV